MNVVYFVNMIHEMDAPRERRRQGTRARIVEAAMALIVAGGFDALSMSRLADAVELTPGALYRYFRSKDAVVAAVTAAVVVHHVARAQAAAAALPAGAPSLDRARALLRAWRELALAEVDRYGLLSMLLAEPRVLVPDAADAAAPLAAMEVGLAGLVEALGGAVAEGALAPGDARGRAVALFGLVHGLVQLRKQAPRVGLDLGALCDDGVEAMLRGWGAAGEGG